MKQIFTMDVEKNINSGVKFAKILSKHNIKGEFYICGYLVELYPKKCRKMAKNHIIGGHGYFHENFAKLSYKKQKKLIKKTKNVFEENKIKMRGWRFPFLSFKNESLKILANLKIFDSSINKAVLKKWGRFIFVRNWVKNLMNGNFCLPLKYPNNLEERPWDVIDLDTKNFFKRNGRIIIHCYNFQKYENEIKNYLKKLKSKRRLN